MPSGTGIFAGFSHKQMIVVRFFIKGLHYGENDASKMQQIRDVILTVGDF